MRGVILVEVVFDPVVAPVSTSSTPSATCKGAWKRPSEFSGIASDGSRTPSPSRWASQGHSVLPVPILKQGEILIASIQAALSDNDLNELKDELAKRVGELRIQGVVIDVTALDVLDSFASRTIRGISYVTKLRGADTVVVGIQPDVAFSMVKLGLTLDGVATALDLEEGLDFLRQAGRKYRASDT